MPYTAMVMASAGNHAAVRTSEAPAICNSCRFGSSGLMVKMMVTVGKTLMPMSIAVEQRDREGGAGGV